MHGHLRQPGCQMGMRGDEVAQPCGETRVGLDDVQAAAAGQFWYQGAGDRSGPGAGFQHCQRAGRLRPYGLGVLATKSDTLPAPIAERLGLLRTTSVEALTDLRDVLGVLHDSDAAQTSAALTPVMRDVRELADEARAAGQHIGLIAEGRPEEAPTTHRLAVYRIVQEALTNARKHAAGAPVTVRIHYRPPATLVEVTNPPGTPRTDTVGSGCGLVGLRERVTALGGHLNSGPAGAGAWRLAARIPHPADIEQNGTRT
jgi:signal transduction histidine kinase